MTRKAFQNAVTALLPSVSAREAVAQKNFAFSDRALLRIIYEYAPTLDMKLTLFEQAKTVFAEKSAKLHAQKLIDYYMRQLNDFRTPKANTIYEVVIKSEPDITPDRYLVPTYEDALSCIECHLKYCEIKAKDESPLARYTISRRSTVAPRKPSDIGKLSWPDECILGYKRKIIDVRCRAIANEWRDKCPLHDFCYKCKYDCIDKDELPLPRFLNLYDLVRIKYTSGETEYGIYAYESDEDDYTAYVYMLDHEYVKERCLDKTDENGIGYSFYTHDHIPLAIAERVDPETVPESVRADYLYAKSVVEKEHAEMKENGD